MLKTLLISLLLLSHGADASIRVQAPAASTRPQSDDCPDTRTCRELFKRRSRELNVIAARLHELEGVGAAPQTTRGRGGDRRRAASAPGATPPPAAQTTPSPLTPDDFLAELRAALDRPEKPVDEQTERNGNIQIVKDLSIGVLKVEYDKDVKAGRAFTLKVTITPRQVIDESLLRGLSHAPVTFYVEPSYKFMRSDVFYDEAQSHGAELREFGTQDMTWSWKVTPREDFGSDKTDLILRAQARIGERATEWQIVSRSEIEFKESGFSSFIIAYANVITAIIAFFGGILGCAMTVFPYTSQKKGKQLKELRRKFKSQQAHLNGKDRELDRLRDDHSRLQSTYYDLRRRWERRDWLRQVYR